MFTYIEIKMDNQRMKKHEKEIHNRYEHFNRYSIPNHKNY